MGYLKNSFITSQCTRQERPAAFLISHFQGLNLFNFFIENVPFLLVTSSLEEKKINNLHARSYLVALLFLSMCATLVFAESRARPYPEEYFTDKCQYIFIGKVLEINGYGMPIRAQVLLSIKGNVQNEKKSLITKHPGRSVIFEEEFDKARQDDIGIFYLFKYEGHSQPTLWKYKTIPYVEESTKNDKK